MGSRFCENCGADLETLNRTSPQSQSWPQPGSASGAAFPSDEDPASPNWRMAPLPEEELPPSKRRIWVWVLVILLLACLTICVASFGWLGYTDSGQNFQTRVAEEERINSSD